MENLDIQHNIEKQIKALTQKTNKIKFNKMLLVNQNKYQKYKKLIFFTDNQSYLPILESIIPEHHKEQKNIWLLKICIGNNKYDMKVYYIYQTIKETLDTFKNLYYYTSTTINDLFKQNLTAIVPDAIDDNFFKYVEENGEKYISFFDDSKRLGEVVYGYVYKLKYDVYINENNKEYHITYDNCYDDTEMIAFNFEEDKNVEGECIHLITFLDDKTYYERINRECHG